MTEALFAVLKSQKAKDSSIIAHFSGGHLQHFKRGETIVNGNNEEPKGVYLIKKGFVKACSSSKDGHENLLFIHEIGEFVPLPWALNGVYDTGLSYIALTDVSVLLAPKDKLRAAMGNNSWLAQEVLRQAVSIISVYTRRIQALEFRSARGKVISELITLAERFGKPQGSMVLIDAPITHQEIADSLNMSRETASKTLELLFKEGLIDQKNHLFTINNLSNLRQVLS